MSTQDIATLGIRVDARQVRDGDQALQRFEQTGVAVERQTDRTNAALARMAKMAATVAAAIAAMKVIDYVREATLLAARYETLGVVMATVGKNAGYSAQAMEGFAKGLQSQGISMIASRQSVIQLAQAHVDMSKSLQLARIAQDAAVIGGINSSEAFERMVAGIQKGEIEILRSIGLTVNFQSAYAQLAATLHKHVDLLTETEKTQARVNAVLAVGTDIAGSYESAMNTAGKQLSSLARYTEDLKVKLGGVFLGAFTRQIELQTAAFKALGVEMDQSLKGGAMLSSADTLGSAAGKAAAAIVALTNFVRQHGDAVANLLTAYAAYRVALVALPLLESAAGTGAMVKALLTQGTVTWGVVGANLAAARAQAVATEADLARALSSNAVAISQEEEAVAVLAATTSIQGQFIAQEALTAAQATAAGTTSALVVAQGEAAVAAGTLAAAEGAATVGAWSLAAAVGALEAVLAILLAPITLIVAAVVALTYAWRKWRETAEKKVDVNLPSFDATTEQLRKLNEEQQFGTGLLGENAKQIAAVTDKLAELNKVRAAKDAGGAGNTSAALRLRAEVAAVDVEVKKYKTQLSQLEEIRAKISGKDTRQDMGSFEALNALSTKYTLPPPRKSDVLATVQPAIDAAKLRAENIKYAGATETEQAKAKAEALAGIETQAKNTITGIEFAFASETNTANRARETALSASATRQGALLAKARDEAQALYDARLTSQAEFVARQSALDAQETKLAVDLANEKIRVARMTVTNDPAAKAQAITSAIAERDAAVTKGAAQAAEDRRRAAEAAIESYTKEYGSIVSLVDAQEELVRSTRTGYAEAGKTAEQVEVLRGQRMQAAADVLSAEMEDKRAHGQASREYINNTTGMINALNQMGQARIKAVGTNVAAGFINDAKAMRDETAAIYRDMAATFTGTDEERIRSAAAASVALAAIRKADALAAITATSDTEGQKAAARAKVAADYNTYVAAVTANADARVMQSSVGFKELAADLAAAFDTTKVEQFGSAMQQAFGAAGGAVGGLIDAMTTYGQQQAATAQARTAANEIYKNDSEKLAKAQAAITTRQTKDSLGYYANVAGAAKSFFKENTTGYKVMEAAEKTFRAFELALSIQTAMQKMGLLTAVTTAHATATATQTATTVASVGPDVAASAAKGQAAAAAGVAGQAQGDPYTAWARMAAMAAAMAALGFAVTGGGGNVDHAAERQKAQGAGTVLGDSGAKSNSIARAIELSASNSSTQINYLSGMLSSLRSIEDNIGKFASTVLRTTDISNPDVGTLNSNNGGATTSFGIAAGAAIGAYFGPIGAAIGAVVGLLAKNIPIIGRIATSIFGGKQSVEDSGFTMDKGSLGSILANGANASQFAEVKTSGGWFSSDKYSTKKTPLGGAANKQFTAALADMYESISQAAGLLGVYGNAFDDRLNAFVVDIGEVSLKGLQGDELNKAIESVFSKLGDQMAEWAVEGLGEFAKAGEGSLETLVRVASDYAKLDASLASIGTTFGAVGLESVGARESLIALMGGIDQLQSTTADFAQNFLSEAQRLAPVQAFVTDELAKMGLGWVNTREEFAQVTLAQDKNTEAGRAQFAALMNLESAFALVYKSTEDTAAALADKLDAQLDAVARAVEAEKALKEKANAATMKVLNAAITSAKTGVQDLTSLSKALHAAVSTTSAANPSARADAQAQIQTALALARAGGVLPKAEDLQAALQTLAADSTGQFSNQADYLRDRYMTAVAVSDLADVTDTQLGTAERQLAVLEATKDATQAAFDAEVARLDGILETAQRQVDATKGVDVSVQELGAALAGLQTLMAGDSSAAIVGAYGNALGRAPDAAGMSYWQNAAAGGMSTDSIVRAISTSAEAQDKLEKLYENVLGRQGDSAGLSYWLDRMANGVSLATVEQSFRGSDEYRANVTAPAPVSAQEAPAPSAQGLSAADAAAIKTALAQIASYTQRAAVSNEDMNRRELEGQDA